MTRRRAPQLSLAKQERTQACFSEQENVLLMVLLLENWDGKQLRDYHHTLPFVMHQVDSIDLFDDRSHNVT